MAANLTFSTHVHRGRDYQKMGVSQRKRVTGRCFSMVQLVSGPFLFLAVSLVGPEVGSLLCHVFLVPQCFSLLQSRAMEPAVEAVDRNL